MPFDVVSYSFVRPIRGHGTDVVIEDILHKSRGEMAGVSGSDFPRWFARLSGARGQFVGFPEEVRESTLTEAAYSE